MSHHKNRTVLPGIFLIFSGAVLLLHKLMPGFFGWREIYPLIFLAIGIWLIIEAILPGKPDRGAVFPGTIFLLLGVFFALRNYDLIPYYYLAEIWPIFLIILGFAFLSLFLVNPRDQGNLIPAGLFLFFGILLLLDKLEIIDWNVWDTLADYWPVILILIGVAIIAKSMKKSVAEEE